MGNIIAQYKLRCPYCKKEFLVYTTKVMQIMEVLKESYATQKELNISELADKINISAGQSIYRYLRPLKDSKLIVMKKKKGKGSPVIVSLNIKNVKDN